MFTFIKRLFKQGPATDFKQLVSQGAIIVDVRTKGEYNSGHIKGAINIPLDQVRNRVGELQQKRKPVITCCRSGNRSGIAKGILQSAGIECYNGGAWDALQQNINA